MAQVRKCPQRFSLWPLPPLGEEPHHWRLLMHCQEGKALDQPPVTDVRTQLPGPPLSTLRLCNGLGENLASVQLAASGVVVPPQDGTAAFEIFPWVRDTIEESNSWIFFKSPIFNGNSRTQWVIFQVFQPVCLAP